MLDLTIANVLVALPMLGGAFWLILTNINANKEKHKVTTEAELEKQKATIEAAAKKEEVRILADAEREKVKVQAEVDKIREQGMGGQVVAQIWKAVDNIKEEIEELQNDQAKDHADNALRNEIVQRLQSEVTNFSKLLWDNLITKR